MPLGLQRPTAVERTMNPRIPTLALIICAFGKLAAQTAVSSTFRISTYADANQHVGGYQASTYFDQQGGTLNSFAGSLSVQDFDSVNSGKSVLVTAQASAHWVDAGHGNVAWRNMGWTFNTATSAGAKVNGLHIDAPVWSYTFQATENGQFQLDYNVWATGDPFGLWGLRIDWSGPSGGLDLSDANDPTRNGTFTRTLTAGNTYTVGLYNMANVFVAPMLITRTGHLNADFNWRVVPVPEPSAMFALGLGAMLLLRRKS